MNTEFFVGTSGYSYKEWKGAFYPDKLPGKKMLGFYAQHFPAVEINSTFRRFPTASTVEAWAAQVPSTFRFVLKARQTITHFRRLQNAEEQIDDFINLALLLKERQGPLLFQLPPNFKKDVPRLEAFLNYVAGRAIIVMEFRHESWFCDEVYDCLRAHSTAMCVTDENDLPQAKLVRTADFGYLRFREESYTTRKLNEWIKRIRAQKWPAVYVFFKHEDVGAGPALAKRFLELAQK
jgi:uncharacterized protein YecE (DUF72 family)